jgi:GT2 family glycosyltransferase
MPSVDIVVLNWNRKDVTRDLIESFFKHTPVACRLIIIDQASTDGSPAYLRSLKGNGTCKLTVVLNDENKGFIGGMNQGMAMSDADYVCLANNDLLFTDGWLQEVLAVFEKNRKIGLLNPNSNNLGVHARPGQSIDDLAVVLHREHDGHFSEMPFCIGFCMFIRREVLRKAGLLSTYLDFMFFEDTDYSMKVLKAGYLIGVAKGSYVWHQEHGSFKAKSKHSEELMCKNERIFTEKWGKTLRIGWVIDREDELRRVWEDALHLARHGNYVWLYTTFSLAAAQKILKDKDLAGHAGLRLVCGGGFLGFTVKNIIKKKRIHLMVNKNKIANALLGMAGIKTMPFWDDKTYQKVKFA